MNPESGSMRRADRLGDRMKGYEAVWAPRLPRGAPVVIRIDGKNFSKWTVGLTKPEDATLSGVMQATTLALMEESGAVLGYSQSDEITLVLVAEKASGPKSKAGSHGASQIYFNGKVQKLASVLASVATAAFNVRAAEVGLFRFGRPDGAPERPFATFDARVFAVPDVEEAAEAVAWRMRDAVKNGLSAVAQRYAGHDVLHGLTRDQRLALIEANGDQMSAYSEHLRWGTLFLRRRIARPFVASDPSTLPPRHPARGGATLVVERPEIVDARTVGVTVEAVLALREPAARAALLFRPGLPTESREWTFELDEVSPGVYRAVARSGAHTVAAAGTDPSALRTELEASIRRLFNSIT
jgi:tRNA(His) guanylyltransferase